MKLKQHNPSDYKIKHDSLRSVPDYSSFMEKATDIMLHFHDAESQQQWTLFCIHLNDLNEKRSEKLMLLKTVYYCFVNPITNAELAQFITLATHLKSELGLRLYRKILQADIPESKRCLQDYISVFLLLIDLCELKQVTEKVEKCLPDLQNLFSELTVLQNQHFSALYPKRNIDTVLERFATVDPITPFPLKKEMMTTFKGDYLAIEARISKITSIPQELLKSSFLASGKLWRTNKNSEAKINMIAILVETYRRFFRMMSYDTQIITLLALIDTPAKHLKGRIAQVKTGEGKSTIFAMLVGFKAAQGYFVDLITSNEYLAIRDCERFAPFYDALGLTASHICYKIQKQSHFHAHILYGTNSNFEFAFLRDGLNKAKLRYSYPLGGTQLIPRTYDVVLIDEVDNMLLDTNGSARMSLPGFENIAWVYSAILNFVTSTFKNKPIATNSGIELRAYLQKNINAKYIPALNQIPDVKLIRWINSAQIAWYQKKVKRDYVVTKDIEIVDYVNTGRINKGCQWEHGIHQFCQAKEHCEITPESLTSASIAHPTFFALYQESYGLTGTMGELIERNEVEELYLVDTFDVPPHFPNQRIALSPKLLDDEIQQYAAIVQCIKEMQAANRPILILFESIEESDAFSSYLQAKKISHQLLNEQQREAEEYIIARAGDEKMITVATNAAGRGADIILSPDSKKAGGLHVIYTFYPENLRVEGQGIGRAGRQGSPGSYTLILRMNDHRIVSLLTASFSQFSKQWTTAQSDQQKLEFLNQLRTQKIQAVSKQRRYTSKLESLYFNCMTDFFSKLQSLRHAIEDDRFKDDMKQMCGSEQKSVTCLLPLKEENVAWKNVYRHARILLANAAQGKQVDWSLFLEQYQDIFINSLLEFWGVFYSKLCDQVDGMDIISAEKHIKESYAKLNLSAYYTTEHMLTSLSYLLYTASMPKKENITATNHSNLGIFPQNNEALYQQAVDYFNGKDYKNAVKFCGMAIKGFINRKGGSCIAVGNCHSTLASCYRELKLFDESLLACERAIGIFNALTTEEKAAKLLTHTITKYQECLVKSGFDYLKLYPQAVALCEDKNYRAACCNLIYLIEKTSITTPIAKGNCYLKLTSCYRELGDKEKAIEACNHAIALCKGTETQTEERTKLYESALLELVGLKLGSRQLDFI